MSEKDTKESKFPNGFLPFLPGDNDASANPEIEGAIETINEDLGCLLRLSSAEFWGVVRSDTSLAVCIDTYLRFRRRAFDDQPLRPTEDTQPSHASQELARRMFMVMLRMVTVEKSQDAKSQAALLYDQWILDVPKILDIGLIYGAQNSEQTRHLLHCIFDLQPAYKDDLINVVPTIVDNLQHIALRCRDTTRDAMQGQEDALAGWRDALIYVQDICITLSVLLEHYPPAGHLLMEHSGALLSAVADAHDSLMPQVMSAIQQAEATLTPSSSEQTSLTEAVMLKKSQFARIGLERLAFLLFKSAFCEVLDAKEATESPVSTAPEERGTALMAAVLSVAQLDERDAAFSLVQQVQNRFQLSDTVESAMEKGLLSLDDTQFDYLMMLLGIAPKANSVKAQLSDKLQSSNKEVVAGPSDMDEAVLSSLISQISEVLPGYGEGFLAACLAELDMDPEKVMHHLLEGSLPPSLTKLDPHMPKKRPEDGIAQPAPSAQSSNAPEGSNWSWSSLVALPDDLGPGWNAEDIRKGPKREGSSGGNQHKVDRKTAKLLDGLDDDMRRLVLEQADAYGLEYEDEYDDSYDGLIACGADGLADVEGDGTHQHVPLAYRDEPGDQMQNTKIKPGSNVTSSGPRRTSGAMQDKQRGKKGQKPHAWVLKDRIYNYAKEGATPVTSQAQAEHQVKVNREAEQYGEHRPDTNIASGSNGIASNTMGQRVQGRGRGGHGRQSHASRGRGKRSHANHNRKDRALRKMSQS